VKGPLEITGRSALYAILGDPVDHSLSPVFQNEAFRAAGVDGVYVPLQVPLKDLPAVVKALSHTSLGGFNATIPLKESLAGLCAELSDEARLIGAVNAVELKDGRIIGHNTDGRGFLASLKEDATFNVKGKRVCLLGAGGASRAIAFTLAKAGAARIVICNRTAGRAKTLVGDLTRRVPNAPATGSSLRMSELSRALEGTDLIVQTTPVGLGGQGVLPLPWGVIRKTALVVDIVYRPAHTPFLVEARRRGHPTLGGLGMLVRQGALAFEIWTGKKPDVARMRKAAEQALRHGAA